MVKEFIRIEIRTAAVLGAPTKLRYPENHNRFRVESVFSTCNKIPRPAAPLSNSFRLSTHMSLPTSSLHPSMSPIRPPYYRSCLGVWLSIFRDKLSITSIAAKIVPLVTVCGHKLRCLIFVAATACQKGGGSELMQCQISSELCPSEEEQSLCRCCRIQKP